MIDLATISELMLKDYTPGKYALHTKFGEYYPRFDIEQPSMGWYSPEEIAEVFNYNPIIARFIGGLYDPRIHRIAMNRLYTHPRMPSSLDANLSRLGLLIQHEGAHAYKKAIPFTEQDRLTSLTGQQWHQEETPPWLRGLLQRGYQHWDQEKPMVDYYQRLWDEGLAHAAQEGGYTYRPRHGVEPEPVTLPDFLMPYLEKLQQMQMPIGEDERVRY